MNYRSDIDGLRAIAVLMVILFHAGFAIFPSGFIGVDIFFVISGFLISGIIKDKIDSGSFTFKEFYLRRLWRLMPAMLAMIVFSFLIATVFYLPADYAPYLKSINKTLLVVSNKYFGDVTSAYAAPDADSMLLLHTWSLSVEWQWYLLFPAIYFLSRKKVNSNIIHVAALAITFVSILLAYHYSSTHPTKTYYFFASRLFEFMIGMCCCLFLPKLNIDNKIFKNAISLLAILCILFVALNDGVIQGYPNAYTLLVCLSTATLIVSGYATKPLINRALSLKPMVWVGTISYSLYLFHWPVFSALHYIGITNLYARVTGTVVSILLACACYYFIEKPNRKPRSGLGKSLLILLLIPFLITVIFTAISKRNDEFSYLRFGKDLHHVNDVLKSTNLKQRQACMNENVSGTDMNCVVGDKSSENRALLMGDSHSNQYWNFFDIMGNDAHVLVDMKATSLCLTLPDIYHEDKYLQEGDYYKTCRDNVKSYYDDIKSKKYKYVIISEVWPNYPYFNVRYNLNDKLTEQQSITVISKALDDGVKQIVEAGAQPILVKTMFAMPQNYLTCFFEHYKTRKEYAPNQCNPSPEVNTATWVDQLFSSIKEKYPTLIIIDPKDVQCPDGMCRTEIKGIPLYRDVGHLNDYATTELGKEYLQKYGNPFLTH